MADRGKSVAPQRQHKYCVVDSEREIFSDRAQNLGADKPELSLAVRSFGTSDSASVDFTQSQI
jgi:hypothetical protein